MPAAKRKTTSRAALFDLYGGFAVEGGRPGELSLRAIVTLAGEIGIASAAARGAAQRMVRNEWLTPKGERGAPRYALSAGGRALIDEGRGRIFGARARWTGSWQLVAVSVPERDRAVRDRLRKELVWLGFGNVAPGLFMSAHDHSAEMRRLASEFKAEDWIQVYRADPLLPASVRVLIRRAWPSLSDADRRYRAFIRRFSNVPDTGRRLAHAAAFAECFRLLIEFRRCLYMDPELPAALLPARWPGTDARALFDAAHASLIGSALRHFDSVATSRRDGPAA